MKANIIKDMVIMCGGRGRRLGPMAEKLPKPLMRIGDKTILELKLRNYMRQGVRDFIICIGYKGALIKEEIKRINLQRNCRFCDSGEPAGILRRLYDARDLFGKEIILTYGDTYTDMDLAELCKWHREGRNESTIVVAPIQNPFGLVEFDSNGSVTSFKEKPILNYYIGYAVINKTALDMIPDDVIAMPDGEGLVTFYKILMAMGKLGVFYHTNIQITFNTENELEIAQKRFSFYTAKEEG